VYGVSVNTLMCSRTHMPNYAVFVYESALFNTAITHT